MSVRSKFRSIDAGRGQKISNLKHKPKSHKSQLKMPTQVKNNKVVGSNSKPNQPNQRQMK